MIIIMEDVIKKFSCYLVKLFIMNMYLSLVLNLMLLFCMIMKIYGYGVFSSKVKDLILCRSFLEDIYCFIS